MKQIGVILLLLAVGLAGYFLAYEKIVRDMLGIPKPLSGPLKSLPVYVAEKEPEKPKEAPKPEPKVVEAPKPPPPKVVEAPKPPPEAPKPVSRAEADGFVPPIFPPIDEATKNWTQIPRSAFTPPRAIKVNQPVEYVSNVGKVTAPAGSTAYAAGQEGTFILVAPSPTSSARGKVSIDNTDLKAILTQNYATWTVEETNRLRLAYREAKAAGKHSSTALGGIPARAPAANANVKNDKPVKDKNGYPVLADSMKLGKVTEITTENITKLSEPTKETLDGKDYWVIVVDYTTKTMFGDFKSVAKAYVFNNSVEKWIYAESGEIVP